MPWSGEHRGFVVEAFFKNGESVIATQREFRTRFVLRANKSVPDRKTILLWVRRVRATGSALKRKPPGRPKNVRTSENIAAVRASIEQSPARSARKHAKALGISERTVRRILHTDLHLHPYKIMVCQKLSPADYGRRLDCCKAILAAVPPTGILWSSDEAHFHLSGTVNKQNFRYWAAENPRELHALPLHSPKVTVWCAMSSIGIIGPYFFEEGGVTVTVNSNRYCNMLENFLCPKNEEYRQKHNLEDFWFQQDGATAHTARRPREILQEMFPGRVISLHEAVQWPPCSPDLSPCDFFLWGYLKAEVFKDRPTSLNQLKEAIQEEIEGISSDMLARVMQNFQERLQMCIGRQGHHLDDIIFKT
ncbi:Mariner Mos1 transposase [Anthophora plagiata]